MATPNQEAEAAYVRDHWDSQAKATNYLLAGHGAVLLGCLTLFKDGAPILKGLSLLGFLSSVGLLLASFAFASITILRSNKVKSARGTSHRDASPISAAYKFFQIGSFLVFVAVIVIIAFRFAFS